MAVLCALLEMAAFWGWTTGPHEAIGALVRGEAPFLASAFAGVLVLYRASAPGPRAWRRTLGAAGVCECAQWLLRLYAGQRTHALLQSVGFGAGSVAAVSFALRYRRGDLGSRRARGALLPAAALVAFVVLSSSLIDLTRTLHPITLDGFTYHADAGYGFPVSFAVGTLFDQVKVLRVMSLVVYLELPLACALVQADELSTARAPGPPALALVMTIGLVGSAFYHLFPVAGPAYAFEGRYPYLPPSPEHVALAPMLVTASVARNCMPSLHTAWALALVWQTRGAARWLRYVTWWCLAWTVAATLGLGYHYVVDLVVAVPFLTFIRALCAWHSEQRAERARALVGGLSLVLAWLFVLRWHTERLAAHVAMTYLLSIASTVLAFLLDVRLFSAAALTSSAIPAQCAGPRDG